MARREEAAVTVALEARPGLARVREALGVQLELGKFRLSGLVVLTALAGYAVGGGAAAPLAGALALAAGTALAAGGANALNQWLEADRDALMERTRGRPVPSGRIPRGAAGLAGLAWSAAGVALLAAGTNGLTAVLGAVVVALYVLAYTPLKTRTPAATLVGAVCGAIPPVMGWTAATGGLAPGALWLGALLFVWQIPHFLALAWLYREDYARGGFRMLPALDPGGSLTSGAALLWAVALLPVTVAIWQEGLAGAAFLGAGAALAGALALAACALVRRRTAAAARRLFLASVIYLPLVLGALVADMEAAGNAPRVMRTAPPARTAALLPGPR